MWATEKILWFILVFFFRIAQAVHFSSKERFNTLRSNKKENKLRHGRLPPCFFFQNSSKVWLQHFKAPVNSNSNYFLHLNLPEKILRFCGEPM